MANVTVITIDNATYRYVQSQKIISVYRRGQHVQHIPATTANLDPIARAMLDRGRRPTRLLEYTTNSGRNTFSWSPANGHVFRYDHVEDRVSCLKPDAYFTQQVARNLLKKG